MKTVVKRSKIHGKGLFAAKFIAEGDVIGVCETRPALEEGPYTLFVDENEGSKVEVICQLRFVNHSGEPNVAYCDDLTLVALENIQKGVELTHNYDGDEESEEELIA